MELPELFRVLGEDDQRGLLERTKLRRFGRGEILWHEGDPGDTVHVIRKGHVAIRVTGESGRALTLDVFGPGQVLGELAVLGAEPRRSATAAALDPAETMSLDAASFTALRRDRPSVGTVIERMLVERLRVTSARFLEAVTVPADARVLRRLNELARLYAPDGSAAVVPLSQEELADIAGTTRVTVNRVLRAEEERGILALGRGRVTVNDREGLERRAR